MVVPNGQHDLFRNAGPGLQHFTSHLSGASGGSRALPGNQSMNQGLSHGGFAGGQMRVPSATMNQGSSNGGFAGQMGPSGSVNSGQSLPMSHAAALLQGTTSHPGHNVASSAPTNA